MTILIYFEKNQEVNIKIKYNRINQAEENNTDPTTSIQSNEVIEVFPFTLARESCKNITVHVYTSSDFKNIIFDHFRIRLLKENAYINLFVEKKDARKDETIVVEFQNPHKKNGKSYFVIAKTSWQVQSYDKFLKDEKCEDFSIEISRGNFFEIHYKINKINNK